MVDLRTCNTSESPARVALESALPVLGVPAEAVRDVTRALDDAVLSAGAEPVTIAVIDGRPAVGVSRDALITLAGRADVAKANAANLGALMHAGRSAATTVSATIELAAGAGISVLATGGIGGVHPGPFDVSADLLTLTRFPVAVVCSGCKSLLNVPATREALETLGVPVVGYRTDDFPAFYLRSSAVGVDARFDDAPDLARFITTELARTGRGVIIANPIPESHAIDEAEWAQWLAAATRRADTIGATGRAVTPALLAALHEVSGGATLRANLALAESNARLAGRLASLVHKLPTKPM